MGAGSSATIRAGFPRLPAKDLISSRRIHEQGRALACNRTGPARARVESTEVEQTDILEASGSPPAAVPMLTVFGRQLVPAMYAWRSSGELTQQSPESDANVDRNADLFVSAAPFDLRLETREAPGRVRLIYYAKHFEPAESPESELSVDCLPASPDCRVESRDRFRVVRYTRQVQDDSTLVVQVDYPTFDATDAQIGLSAYSA